MSNSEGILISIQPRHADKIFGGSKTVELRRVCPRLKSGDVAIVYVTSPVKAVQGRFIVEKIVSATPKDLWSQVKDIAGVTKYEYDTYFRDAVRGVAIFIRCVEKLDSPFDLDILRATWPEFRPPQSYRYLRPLFRHHKRACSLFHKLVLV